MFYDSKTQLIQFTDQKKETKMWLSQIADQIKIKLKKYWKVGIKLSKNTLQYKQRLCILTLPKCNA